MKSFHRPTQLLTLAIASLLAFPTLPAFGADAETASLKAAQNELATLKNKYTDEHPRVIDQKQRIAQLQRRIEEEKPVSAFRAPIIRTEVRIQSPKTDGSFELLAAPSLVTQSGQQASLSIGAFEIGLISSVDEQNNITSSVELSMNTADGKPAEKAKLPLIKTRPGERSTIPVPGGPLVEILATLVEPKGISVDFPGGSLAQLLTAVSQSGSEPFNVIAPKEALGLVVPQFSVRNVSPHNLALALDQLLAGYAVDFSKGEYEHDGQPVFTLRSSQPDQSAPKAEKPKPEQFRSYAINRAVLNQIPVDQVIEAINTAWRLDAANKPEALTLKYHAATGILLVSSREGLALQTADQVINSLREQAEFLQHLASHPAPVVTPKP